MKLQSILLVLIASFILSGCSDNGNNPEPSQLSSVYVVNEGNFGDSNGSVSSYDPESETATASAFENANGRPFAGYIQSSTIIGDRLYIVSNMANKIEVAALETLNSIGTIEYSKTPGAIGPAGDGRAYVTNLYDNSVTVVDLENLEETDQTIAVGTQPRNIVQVGGYAFVSNSGGIQTATVDNTVSVIDTETNSVVNTIEVGDKPGKMVVGSSNRIWLICTGLTAYDEDFNRVPEEDTPGGLFVIDAETQTVSKSQTLDERPGDIVLNERDSRVYLLNDNVEMMNMNTFEFEDSNFIDRSFNAIGYSSAQDMIYAGQSKGLTQPGQAIQYNLEGAAVDSFEVGISPVEFEFVTN